MWSGTFFTVMVMIMQGINEPRNIKLVAIPFLCSSLMDIDELHLDTPPAAGLTFFNISAIAIVGVLEVWSHICTIIKSLLQLHNYYCWMHIVSWLESGHMVARGAIVHFVMQIVMRFQHPLECATTTAFMTVLLWSQYKYMMLPIHGILWEALYYNLTITLTILNTAMIFWLTIAYLQDMSKDAFVWVNAIVPIVVYMPSTVYVIYKYQSCELREEQKGVQIELNAIRSAV